MARWSLQWNAYAGGPEFVHGGYLHKFPRENQAIYRARLARAYYPNYVKPLIDVVSDYVFQSDQIDRGSADPQFAGSVDRKGTDANAFMKYLATRALVKGMSFAVVDMPAPVAGVESRADEIKLGVRPYWYPVEREDVLNWELDDFGKPYWVLMREGEPSNSDPMAVSERGKYEYFIVWERQVWRRYKMERGNDLLAARKVEAVSEGVNKIGEVPVVPMYGDKMSDWEGRSWICDVAYVAQALLNTCSLRDNYNYETALEQPIFPGISAEELEKLVRGEHYAIAMPPTEGGALPFFLSPAGTAANILAQQINDHRDAIHQILRQRIINASANADGASGASKQEDFRSTNTAIADVADECERVENELWRLTGEYIGGGEVRVEYPNDYDVSSVDRAIMRATQIQALDPPDEWTAKMQKDILHMTARSTDDPREIKAIEEAIDARLVAKAEEKAAMVEALARGGAQPTDGDADNADNFTPTRADNRGMPMRTETNASR